MLATLFVLIVFGSACRLYFVLPKSKNRHSRSPRKKSGTCTVAIFLGSGGHTSEALTLMSALDPRRYSRRIYIVSEGDNLSVQKALSLEAGLELEKKHFSTISIPRARRVHQPLLTTPLSAFYSLMMCSYHFTLLPLLSHQRQNSADVLILNGPGTCFMLCISVYINKFLGLHAPIVVYVESFARVKSLSLSAKLIRPFADHFITQWSQPHSPETTLTSKNWLV